MANAKKQAEVVVPMDLLDLASMATELKKLSPATQALFFSFDELEKAIGRSEEKTVDLLVEMTDEGIPCKEMVESFESRVKALRLWTHTYNEKTGELKFDPVNKATQTCLSAKIRQRIYHATVTKKPVLDKDGMLQFHDVNGESVTMTNLNTTPTGSYTRGKGRGDAQSISEAEAEKQGNSTGGAQLPNGDKDDDTTVPTSAEVKSRADSVRQVEKAFGTAWKNAKARQKKFEEFRVLLSDTAQGKAFMALFDGEFKQAEQDLVDLSESLHMKTKTVDGSELFYIAIQSK